MSKWLVGEGFIAPLDSYTEEEVERFLSWGCWIEEDGWLEAYKSEDKECQKSWRDV